MRACVCLFILWVLPALSGTGARGQVFWLEKRSDSLYVLTLETRTADGQRRSMSRWKLPYPVYRMATGDVDGDGREEALVGVVKRTRYSPEVDRRLFVFKNVKGHIRPLWMGTRLGGRLVDFRVCNGRLRSLERSTDGQRFAVAEYGWSRFGPAFERYLTKNRNQYESMEIFHGNRHPDGRARTDRPDGRVQTQRRPGQP